MSPIGPYSHVGRTLLIGSQTGVWRDWLAEQLGGRRFVGLDPADASRGTPGRLAVFEGESTLAWRFFGSLDARRAPHVLAARLPALLEAAGPEAVVELFPYRPGPLRLQLARLVAELVLPEAILVDRRCRLEPHGWPAPITEVELPEPLPASVLAGQRKARWLQMIELGEAHELDLRRTAIEGARLGSGIPVPLENLRKYGFQDPVHAEASGSTLYVISNAEVEDVEISRALDAVHASKAVVASPRSFENLLCSFARENGEEFGIGRVIRLEMPLIHVMATAVPPIAVPLLKLGGLRVDSEGRELSELRPWEV